MVVLKIKIYIKMKILRDHGMTLRENIGIILLTAEF